MKVTVDELDRLLRAEVSDPKLILDHEEFRVVPVGTLRRYPGARGVISQAALRAQLPRGRKPTTRELATRATILNSRLKQRL
ncbi:hypothetical protein FPZ12_040420 [Amycolatopsis acidicola]|uniref:Uncharacterized protein n=1 Tax=Amycolatopsis acidicola TaxID=2596893 RepID=A0A5N0UQ60_9PSEU|nr:hypothetical protein [Amycolatopsis acidicola]KAA9150786.1 hypothetical protein FPZ12_040420 [Amycolatopsis acidicola]